MLVTMSTRLTVIGLGGLLALSACAANTPQQTLAYERWSRCAQPYTTLLNVDVQGRIVYQFSDSATRQDIETCLAQAARSGSPLPPPTGVRPPGGP
jgi:hypothetical protein